LQQAVFGRGIENVGFYPREHGRGLIVGLPALPFALNGGQSPVLPHGFGLFEFVIAGGQFGL
jgi:hypothetical protein